ncbi:MAG: hypothetical protein Q4C70_04180, partial [Planctomycetia bacterium]|nr:hypothetical protein [Planctomycetia bacterium]
KIPQKNVLIENVILRMLYSEFINSTSDELVRRLEPIHYVRALRLKGENITVTDNDIHCAAGGVFELKCYWSTVQFNRFSRGNIVGWNGFSGQQLRFCNNHLAGTHCTSFYGSPGGSENIFWAKNIHENNFDGNNRETITGDGHFHGYFDRVKNIMPTSFTLLPEIKNERGATLTGRSVLERGISTWYRPENELQRNGIVQIASGKGVGQFRRIREIVTDEKETMTVKLDRPWDILPDSESVIAISSFRRHFIYYRNQSYDSTCALQFYGSLLESLILENQTARTGGFNGDSMTGEPCWYNQFLNNEILNGNSYRGPRNESPATDAQLGLLSYGDGIKNYRYPLLRGCVVRGNHLVTNAFINVKGPVTDAILEGNCIENSDRGIVMEEAATGIWLGTNYFQHVKKPFQVALNSVISPHSVVRLSNIMNMGFSEEDFRQSFITRKEDNPEKITENYVKWFQSLMEKYAEKPENTGETVNAETPYIASLPNRKTLTVEDITLLTGLEIKFPNWKTAEEILENGASGTAPLYIQAQNSQVPATLKMWVDPADFPADGWSFDFPELHFGPGNDAAQNMKITKPAGRTRLLEIPICAEISGDGWAFRFRFTAKNPWGAITPTRWEISAPMENPSPTTHPVGIGYVPYEKLLNTLTETIKSTVAPCENSQIQGKTLLLNPKPKLGSKFEEKFPKNSVLYARTTLTAREPAQIRLSGWSSSALIFVNGKPIGTNQARGRWGFADLQEGENLLEIWLCVTPHESYYQFNLPQITWVSRPFAIIEE